MVDKRTVQQLLGSLMKKPQLLSQVDKYSFILTDFPSRFEKYIYSAIEGLYRNGAINIQPIDVENFLSTNQVAAAVFKEKNGIEYLQDIVELSEVENFDYYYGKFKKLNLLKDLKKSGFDITEFYCEDLTNPNAQEINGAFEFLTTKDITDGVRKKLLGLESKYEVNDEVEIQSAATGIEDFVNELGAAYEIGIPIQGSIYNQVIDGAKKGTLTIRSAASGVGKTRNAVADACYLAYPFRYNATTCEWEQEGNNEKVLFIVTEQRFKEVKTMILAYLTDINAVRFKYADFSDRERGVITQAIHLMKKYEDNLILVKMPNPTIELVKTLVRENCLTYDIGYVFYDYIFIGPSLLNEFKGFALRNDEVLLMFATALKDLAVELNVFIMTATQVNANADQNTTIRNESTIAGSRAIINKADIGCVMARPTKQELDTIAESGIIDLPNCVTDIYKVRSGAWSQVRIWSNVNLGNLRKEDLFLTDARLEPIKDYQPMYSYNDSDIDKADIDEALEDMERIK